MSRTSGKSYVGQTTGTVAGRWSGHVRGARGALSWTLGAAIRKYGPEDFDLREVDQAVSQEELNSKEIEWVSRLNSQTPSGYNMTEGGRQGGKFSLVSRERMSAAHMGKKQSPELVEKRVRTLRGKRRPPAVLIKTWLSRPRQLSAEFCAKLSDAHLGVPLSDAHRASMRTAQQERRLREAGQGLAPVFSESSREAMRQAKLGRKLSDETKAKMRASHLARSGARRSTPQGAE